MLIVFWGFELAGLQANIIPHHLSALTGRGDVTQIISVIATKDSIREITDWFIGISEADPSKLTDYAELVVLFCFKYFSFVFSFLPQWSHNQKTSFILV